ncbi:MAG: nucleotidyltransferase domain-containing protein [Candidatus Micrarchaeota archaeon]|nr:nucleotidyltransferase domain-containing protein [Candidatus Micrarchaeota archaeon]
MDIPSLLGTDERVRLLAHLLSHPSEEIVPGALAKSAKVSRSQAHKYAGILRAQGLVRGKMLAESPSLQAVRALLNVERLNRAGVTGILRRRFPEARGIGIYGSFARGANSEGSDLDIWMKIGEEPADLEIAKAKKEIAGKVGAQADIVAATPQRLLRMREKSDAFYFSLYNGILLWGEPL